ncbi:hypothetical protein EDB87DRAFT_423816 [Lactarius vividus]|nr:hypothetical protein EDB87DRAFT_423816 [Lactarius vividus]
MPSAPLLSPLHQICTSVIISHTSPTRSDCIFPWVIEPCYWFCARCLSLHVGSKYSHPEVMQLSLDHSAGVNAKTREQFTPLHLPGTYPWTNHNDDPCTALLLVERGADVDSQSTSGQTPRQHAMVF